jgi:uncharacterized membrane protein (DUF106 family)
MVHLPVVNVVPVSEMVCVFVAILAIVQSSLSMATKCTFDSEKMKNMQTISY